MKRIVLPPALAAVCGLFLILSAGADDRDGGLRDVGPEDGILCCNGVERFLFNGDQVMVTTGRPGILRSEHRGVGWRRSMDGLLAPNGVAPFVDFICQAPSEPRTVYAVAGTGPPLSPFDGLFSSNDFGQTWKRRSAVITGFGFATCDVDPDDARIVYVQGVNDDFVDELWRSSDGGRSFTRVTLPFECCAAFGGFAARVVRGALYLANGDVLYASTDGGASFRSVPTPPGLIGSFTASADGRRLFVRTVDDAFNQIGVFRSTDGGASYQTVTGLPNGGLSLMQFDPSAPSRVYTSDGLLRVSNDAGLSFSLLPASDDPRFFGGSNGVREIGVDRRGSVYLGTVGGPFRTDDGGRTFRSLSKDFRASAVQDLTFAADGKLLVGVLHTHGVFRQVDGATFRPIGTPLMDSSPFELDTSAVAGSPVDPSVLVVTLASGGLFRTGDGGRSWTSPTVPGSPAFYGNARIAFPTASRVYVAVPTSSGIGFYRSDDAGETFVRLSRRRVGAIAVDPANPDVLYLGDYSDYMGAAGLFKSSDGGQTLGALGQPGLFSALAVDRHDSNVIYAGERFGGVLRSSDGGRTFVAANSGLAGAGVHGLVQDVRGTLFVWIRGGGLFSSDDGASTWQPVDTGEALRRSGVEAGRGTLVADPRRPGRLYLGHGSVLQIDVEDRDE